MLYGTQPEDINAFYDRLRIEQWLHSAGLGMLVAGFAIGLLACLYTDKVPRWAAGVSGSMGLAIIPMALLPISCYGPFYSMQLTYCWLALILAGGLAYGACGAAATLTKGE